MPNEYKQAVKKLRIEDLRFRWFNGESEAPFKRPDENAGDEECRKYQDQCRWWDQESVACGYAQKYMHVLRDDLLRPMKEWPPAIAKADAPLGSKAVALTGFLNTKQWDIMCYNEDGSFCEKGFVWRFEGYFDRPINSFRLKSKA